MSENGNQSREWSSRFGYIMVAAGAAIGLGNIWKFPYLAYQGGGGVFLVVYILIVAVMAHPMVEMETAIGRHSASDTVTCFERINKKWGFVGWLANICTLLINMYYVVVGGWVLKYAFQYIISGDFGSDKQAYFTDFTTSTVEPIIWAMILLAFVSILLLFGITNLVEKVTKIIMPILFLFLIICGIWAIFVTDNAIEGLKYYLLPDFSKFNFTVFSQAATQVLFSVGIGWGIYETLGANIPKKNNLKSDAILVSICDTGAAILAGDAVFVQLSLGKAGHKAAPHAGVGLLHGNARPPAVKAAADLHSHSPRGPHGKPPALLPKVIPAGVRAQHTVGIKAFARKERAVDGGKIHADFSFSQRDTPGHIYQ